MHVNTIKAALWSPATEEVFYVFDLAARYMNTWAVISNCGFSNVLLSHSLLKGRKSHLHSFMSREPGKNEPFTFKRCTTTSAN